MQLYTGHSQQFVEDATHDRIAQKLEQVFVGYFGHELNRDEKRFRGSLGDTRAHREIRHDLNAAQS